MRTNDVVSLATKYAAGDLAYDGLLEGLGNDRVFTDKIVALIGSVGVGGIAASLADTAVETARKIPIVGGAIGLADDALEGATDFLDDLW